MEEADLAIIGAGWHGLAMAKTYHEVWPDARIVILDASESVGGCWSAERLYPGLVTNNVYGTYEFSDFPMLPAHPGQHIPGLVVHDYLREAVKYFDIERFLRLNTKVLSATLLDDDTWNLVCESSVSGSTTSVHCNKLVLATGLTSEPSRPIFSGEDRFGGVLMHSKELKPRAQELSQAHNVVVVGGNKSAWDVCYSVARRGGQAHMVIRPSGGGPSWTWPTRFSFVGWKTAFSRLTLTRIWTLFDPWPFAGRGWVSNGVHNFLHRWKIGQAITQMFWGSLGRRIRAINGYDSTPNTAKLAPWSSVYWMGNSLSILNYPTDWFELARENRIIVHHADIVELSQQTVKLSDDTSIAADAVVCCTGWKPKPSIQFLPDGIDDILGLPGSAEQYDTELIQKSREHILEQRPYLKTSPRLTTQYHQYTPVRKHSPPFRLYRCLVPSNERLLRSRNIAFIGYDYSLHTLILAQAQALWITAFFADRIDHLKTRNIDYEKVHAETVAFSEYEKLRRPKLGNGSGESFADFVFDSLPYVDMLLQDLGVETRRHGGGFFAELFNSYGLRDYRGLVQEWQALHT